MLEASGKCMLKLDPMPASAESLTIRRKAKKRSNSTTCLTVRSRQFEERVGGGVFHCRETPEGTRNPRSLYRRALGVLPLELHAVHRGG